MPQDRWILSSDQNFSQTKPSTKAGLQNGLIANATPVDFFFLMSLATAVDFLMVLVSLPPLSVS